MAPLALGFATFSTWICDSSQQQYLWSQEKNFCKNAILSSYILDSYTQDDDEDKYRDEEGNREKKIYRDEDLDRNKEKDYLKKYMFFLLLLFWLKILLLLFLLLLLLQLCKNLQLNLLYTNETIMALIQQSPPHVPSLTHKRWFQASVSSF